MFSHVLSPLKLKRWWTFVKANGQVMCALSSFLEMPAEAPGCVVAMAVRSRACLSLPASDRKIIDSNPTTCS